MTSPYFSLNQSHLQLLSTCPPQFQRRYLEQLGGLIEPDHQAKAEWGKTFHQLMQQWALGLPVETMLSQSPDPAAAEFRAALQTLVANVPALQLPPSQRQAEHQRTFNLGADLLTVVYDLLVILPDRAEILDWKTYPQPAKKAKITDHWQTKLYLYVLAETSNYAPEQLSMTYWFVQATTGVKKLTIPYHQGAHDHTHQELTHLLAQFHQWLTDWQQRQIPFPHSSHCHRCPYHPQFFDAP
ncbi:MAG: PD-(D/E)XK nuclease family protein [Synechocystis sp.]|nr:PD-(D/E)XK nuclease family protein [Synechocystis sp.]